MGGSTAPRRTLLSHLVPPAACRLNSKVKRSCFLSRLALNCWFSGTSLSIYGVTPPSSSSQEYAVTIDSGVASVQTYGDPNPPSYRMWYESSPLPDGEHTVTLSRLADSSVDFAVVGVGESTPLLEERLIVDNEDLGISYKGQWRRSQEMFNSGPLADGAPYRRTTHRTENVGDTFTVRFTGKSVALYGLFSWSTVGLLTLSLTLDGAALPNPPSFRVTTDTPQYLNETGDQQNFQFFNADFLQPTNHTLIVNVTSCTNQSFVFDYLTYTPTFASLSAMPNLAPYTTSTGGTGRTSKFPVAAVAGAIAGVVIALLILAFLLYNRSKKRRRSDSNSKSLDFILVDMFFELKGPYFPLETIEQFNTQDETYTPHRPETTSTGPTPGRKPLPQATPLQATSETAGSSGQSTAGPSGVASSEDGGESMLPPSYDDTMRGQRPLRVTYVIQPRTS